VQLTYVNPHPMVFDVVESGLLFFYCAKSEYNRPIHLTLLPSISLLSPFLKAS
jgi:hypothetical protein